MLLNEFNHIHLNYMIIISYPHLKSDDYLTFVQTLTQIYCKMDHIVHECIAIYAPDLHNKSEMNHNETEDHVVNE